MNRQGASRPLCGQKRSLEPRGFSRSVAERIHNKGECRRGLAAARVVEVIAGTTRAPVRKKVDEAAVSDARLDQIVRKVGNTHPGQGRLPDRRYGVERDAPVDADIEVLAALTEIPDEEATMGRQAQIDAGVFGE